MYCFQSIRFSMFEFFDFWRSLEKIVFASRQVQILQRPEICTPGLPASGVEGLGAFLNEERKHMPTSADILHTDRPPFKWVWKVNSQCTKTDPCPVNESLESFRQNGSENEKISCKTSWKIRSFLDTDNLLYTSTKRQYKPSQNSQTVRPPEWTWIGGTKIGSEPTPVGEPTTHKRFWYPPLKAYLGRTQIGVSRTHSYSSIEDPPISTYVGPTPIGVPTTHPYRRI